MLFVPRLKKRKYLEIIHFIFYGSSYYQVQSAMHAWIMAARMKQTTGQMAARMKQTATA